MKEAHPARTRSLLLSVLILGSFAFQTQAYYHPDEGRWLSRDPIGEGGGVHLYAYVFNAPIQGLDALGLSDLKFVVGGDLKDAYGFNGSSGNPRSIVDQALLATQVKNAIEAYKKETGLDCSLDVEYALSSAKDPMTLARARSELYSPAGTGPEVMAMVFHGLPIKTEVIDPKTGLKKIVTGETGLVLVDEVKDLGFTTPYAVGKPYPLGDIFDAKTEIADTLDEIYVSCCYSGKLKDPALKGKKFFFLTKPTASVTIVGEALLQIQKLAKELCCRKHAAASTASGGGTPACCPADFSANK